MLAYVRVAIYQKFKLNEQLQKYTYILSYTHAKALQNYIFTTMRVDMMNPSQEFITVRVCNSHMVSTPAIWIG